LEYGGTIKASPLHPAGYLPITSLGHILMCNPIAAIITQMRKALIGRGECLQSLGGLRDRRRRAPADPVRDRLLRVCAGRMVLQP